LKHSTDSCLESRSEQHTIAETQCSSMRHKKDEVARTRLIRHKRDLRSRRKRQSRRKHGKAVFHSQRYSQTVWPSGTSSLPIRKGKASVRIPKTFSFIDNAEETLQFILDLNALTQNKRVRTLHIDHSKCKELDLCASIVMDTIIEQRRNSRGLNLTGTFSDEKRVNILLRAGGLLARIHHPSSVLPPDIEKEIKVSDLYYGFSKYSERSRRCDEAATGLTQYFGECLGRVGAVLSRVGANRLSTLISEALSNAEEHAKGKWYAKAHFDRLQPNEQEGGACHIVLLNFSQSNIFNSFQKPEASSRTFQTMQAYAAKHRHGLLQDSFSEEALCTLYALQEGITSVPERRGTGTTNLIDFFLQLAGKKKRMCVLSGKALILFDGKYVLKSEEFPGGDRKVIAFNDENSLERPPDSLYVRTLSRSFPGTLISIKFNLKEKYAPAEGALL
jgi:hypothetical protein